MSELKNIDEQIKALPLETRCLFIKKELRDALRKIAFLMYQDLFTDPDVQNHSVYYFRCTDPNNVNFDYRVILQKRGGDLPDKAFHAEAYSSIEGEKK